MAGRSETTSTGARGNTSRRRVLFAAMTEKWPITAMLRAHTLAQTLGAELHVLRVYTLPQGGKRHFWQHISHDVFAELDRTYFVMDSARRWSNYILPGAVREDALACVQGDFVEQVIVHAQKLHAEMVVIPEEHSGVGLRANHIAVGAQVPVLVSRLPRTHNTILVATDLSDSRYPVVCHAALLRSMLTAELVLMHNVAPLSLVGSVDNEGIYWDFSRELAVASSTQRLESVARVCSPCMETIVTNRLDTKRAILASAQKHDADLVAVGARPCSSLSQLLGGNVAARVAEQARRSVLLIPMSASAH